MFGNVNLTLRPIKIAFLVDPRIRKDILAAIEVNSFLWGGQFNPIIPVLKKVPAVWKRSDKFINYKSNAKKIILGYLDAFDPDYFAIVGNCDVSHLKLDDKRIININDILASIEKDGIPSYGIGIFEILRDFIEKELKFVRKKPLKIFFVDLEKKYELFLASIFGKLPDKLEKRLRKNYRDYLNAEDRKASISNYSELMNLQYIFTRRITSFNIDARSSNRRLSDECIFFLDAVNNYDIIDYWNLRAMGWKIIPVSKQTANEEAVKASSREYIEDNYRPSRFNPKIFFSTTILKARSIGEDELMEFIKNLSIPASPNPEGHKYVIQNWYPRMWDEWARDKDDVDGCALSAGVLDHEITDPGRIRLKTIDPGFMSKYKANSTPRFVNKIEFHIYGGKEPYAEVIPAGGQELIRAIGGISIDNWRFSNRGIFYLSEYGQSTIFMEAPLAEKVFSSWMKSKGWETELSPPGRIAKQMINSLSGVKMLSILSHEEVLSLLYSMENGKTVKKSGLFTEISKMINKGRVLGDKTRIVERLLNANMIRLGMELQCPICQQHSWYSINDLDYELNCPKCSGKYSIPSHDPDKIKWAYRTYGPFSLPSMAYGVYSVLLTLRFFTQLLSDRPVTPMMSFNAKKDNTNIEVDLGLFCEEVKYGGSDTEIIFAECKSYKDEFTIKDIRKMELLGRHFPGSILVFATLKKALLKKEKRLISGLANKGRRYWKADHPYNPVLILTATELFADFGPPECWKDAGGEYKLYAEKYRRNWRELIPLCDFSQQIYLGMKPWHEWLDARREKRRKKEIDINFAN